MKFEITNINVITEDFGTSQSDFWVNIEIDISNVGGYGAEAFNVNVVSTERLNRITENDPMLGRGMIICKDNNINVVRSIIEKIIKKIGATSWETFCTEFEKYFDRI